MTTSTGGPAPRRLVVTGTDTGVGKTVVSAALCIALGAVYVKPAQSGTDDGDDDARDVDRLAGVPTLAGVRLGESLAPSVAARRAGVVLQREDLLSPVHEAMRVHAGRPLVVEGAGGILVELGTDGTTLADLAADLDAEVVVVARPGLGTLNHTMLTLEAADRRGVKVAGVVVSGMPSEPDVAMATNLAELDRLSAGRLAGVLPRLDTGNPLDRDSVLPWLRHDLGGTWIGPTPAPPGGTP